MEDIKVKKIVAVIVSAIVMSLTVAGCGGNSDNTDNQSQVVNNDTQINLKQVMDDINAQFPNSMEDISSTDDLNKYYNISAEDVKSSAASIDKSGIDEVILIEAVDADAATRIETCLKQRYNSKKQQGASYSPEDLQIIDNCSVQTNGNIVSMIVSKDYEGMQNILNNNVN